MSGTTGTGAASQTSAFQTWLRQPSTINGISAVVGSVAALLTHAATGNTTWDAILGAIGVALPQLLINDHTSR